MSTTNARIRALAERARREANNNSLKAAQLLQARTGLGLLEAFEIVEETSPGKNSALRRKRCDGCGVHWADPPSTLCPGCEAYREHQS